MWGMRSFGAVVLCVFGACDGGGGGGGGGDGENSALQGIYMTESHTQSTAGCEGVGGAYPFGHPVFFVKWEEFFGEGALKVFPCDTLEECRTSFAEDDTLHAGGPFLDMGNDSSGWTGEDPFAFEYEGECRASIARNLLVKDGEDGVRIEEREFEVPSFPADLGAEESCPDETVLELGADQPCSTLQVRVGRLIER